MDCPTCRQPMIVLELDRLEVDYCPACQGIWLDEGELELLLEDAVQAHVLLQSFTSVQTHEKRRKCPICLKKMDKVNAGRLEDQVELLDRCPNNHGLWFDRGELQDILRANRFDEHGKLNHFLSDLFPQQKRSDETLTKPL